MPIFPVYDIDYNTTTKKLIAGTFARSLQTFPVDSIINSIITSMDKNPVNAISAIIYPSPAANMINLEIKGNTSSQSGVITVFSMQGRIVKNINTQSISKTAINIEDLPAGAYIVRTSVGDKTLVNRFIKTALK